MRYLRLYRAFVAICLARAMEFRFQFFASIIGYVLYTGISLVFIDAVFGNVGAVRGWSRDEMWVLYGTFVVLESLCYGLLGPNMWRFPGGVRDGSLDMALTKPVDVQFFVSLRYIDLNACLNSILGIVLMVLGFSRIGHYPNALEWLAWLFLLMCGFVMGYSIWFCCVTIAIWAIKLEGVSIVFDPMLQMSRFPIQIYPARVLTFLTIGIPVAFMTTYPTQAALGRIEWPILGAALGMATLFLFISNRFFNFALRSYGSASS